MEVLSYSCERKGHPSPQKRKENTTQKQTHKTSIDGKGREKDVLWKQRTLWLHTQTRLEAYLLSTPAPLTVFHSPCCFPFPAHEADFRSPN